MKMLTDFFIKPLLLLLQHQQQKQIQQHATTLLNFTQIGLTWQFESLYLLYNNNTTKNSTLYEYINEIFGTAPGYFAQKPFLIADLKASSKSLNQIGGFSSNPLMIIMASNSNDPVLGVADHLTRGKKNICIVILLPEDCKENILQTLFEYLFHLQYRRVLVVAAQTHLYTMRAYPSVKAINVTGRSAKDYFPPLMQWNLQGYVLEVPVQIDLPNIFWYHDDISKRIQLDGIGGIMFTAFMQRMNATMHIYPLYLNKSNFFDLPYIEKMLINGTVEISTHLFPTVEPNSIDYSYPYISPDRCLMLPLDDTDDLKISYVMPSHWTIWSMIVLLFVASEILAQLAIRYHPECIKAKLYQQNYLSGTFVFNTICLLLGFSMPDVRFWNIRHFSWKQFIRFFLHYFLITCGGFCFSQMYSSSLTSGLTVSKLVKPKVTVDKLLNMTQPIMVTSIFYNTFLKDKRFGYSVFDKIVFASPEELINNRMAMNTSYVYIISEDRWSEFDEQQKFLTRKRFYLSDICVSNSPLQYQMRLDSAFEPYLRLFVMIVREAGLYSVWKSKVFRSAAKYGYMHYLRDPPNSEYLNARKAFSSTLSNLSYILYFCGLILSTAVFAIELFYNKLQKRQHKQGTVQREGVNILTPKQI